MNGTSFAEQAKPDILELAQEALQGFEAASEKLEKLNTVNWGYWEAADKEAAFFVTQSALRLGLSIAVDLRRIANALERKP